MKQERLFKPDGIVLIKDKVTYDVDADKFIFNACVLSLNECELLIKDLRYYTGERCENCLLRDGNDHVCEIWEHIMEDDEYCSNFDHKFKERK